MKKLAMMLFVPFLLVGCGQKIMNTPTKQVEMFFANYQSLDDSVVEQLNKVANEEELFNSTQRKEYVELMKKHYQDLKYEIKDEIIDGDTATVTVEIEVTDYSKTLEDAEKYLNENKSEFNNDKNEYDESLFTTYRLEQIKKSTDKVKYTLNIYLTKVDNEWKIDDLSETDRMKINGMYEY